MGYRPRDHKGSHTTELLSKQGLGFFFFFNYYLVAVDLLAVHWLSLVAMQSFIAVTCLIAEQGLQELQLAIY